MLGGVVISCKEENINMLLPFGHPVYFFANYQHTAVVLYNYLTYNLYFPILFSKMDIFLPGKCYFTNKFL